MAQQKNPGRLQGREAQRTRRELDARGQPDKLKENRRRLGVGEDHKTEAMRRGRRGTFP